LAARAVLSADAGLLAVYEHKSKIIIGSIYHHFTVLLFLGLKYLKFYKTENFDTFTMRGQQFLLHHCFQQHFCFEL